MRRRSTFLLIFLLIFLVALSAAAATVAVAPGEPVVGEPAVAVGPTHGHPSAQEPHYVGSRDGCRKCHLREYRSWERTPHAQAIEVLEGEDRTDPDCIRCHVTGWGDRTGFVSEEESPQLAGVGCEVCHGPGSEYMDREVMKDRDASIAAGLLIPDEQTCRQCHNEQSPTFPGSFDFEAMRERGVHEIRDIP